jgi:ribosomal protein S26
MRPAAIEPDTTVVRRANKAHVCVVCEAESIQRGDYYAEYVVMAEPYSSGWRYCLDCAVREDLIAPPRA